MSSRNFYVNASKYKKSQPSKHARQMVHDAFSPAMLRDICVRQDFSAYADRYDLVPWHGSDDRFYWYKDNGSDILAIAHLDTVQEDMTCQVIHTAGGLLAVSGALDDRLGAYVILELLPALGITCDWLLTTDEEMGASTASDFHPDKDYNWMFQFDRAGTDVVMYDYETDELCELVEKAGAQVGRGSYSDISALTHLRCAGINWGVGYQEYHSDRSHAWLDDTLRSVARFVKFYRANCDKVFEYEPKWWQVDDPDDVDEWDDLPFTTVTDDQESFMLVSADCGHPIYLGDKNDWMEFADRIVCRPCGEELRNERDGEDEPLEPIEAPDVVQSIMKQLEDFHGTVALGPGDTEPDERKSA